MRGEIVFCVLFSVTAAFAQQDKVHEVIEVTATKVAEAVREVPAAISVVSGEELRARGATDLPSALALVAGLSVTAGGDAGPAGSVPEIGGIREADAFLLVVDGVPWGGAFNPDLPAVDLTNVERIEVLRGPAPVMFGATAFTGVIHVIHRAPGTGGEARVSIGTRSSGAAAITIPLSAAQSLTANYERRGFADERSGFDRAHLLYRATRAMGAGVLRFDADALRLQQSPASPHPRQGRTLTPAVPLDANHNPSGARLDQDTLRATLGYDTKTSATTLSIARSRYDILRGFLTSISSAAPNAAGYAQDRTITDLYFDAHFVAKTGPTARVIAGIDHLYGRGGADTNVFSYFTPLRGGPAAIVTSGGAHTELEARRNFSGLYAQSEWTATPRLRVDAGLRLNHTREQREIGPVTDSARTTKLSGGVGATFRVHDSVAVFANYRDTFKPAALDFSPNVPARLLRPETGRIAEIGVKGGTARVTWEASAFRNDLTNLLVSTTRDGLPALENAGNIRVDGAELEARVAVAGPWRAQFAYAYHDARFGDYVQAFDGVPTQLSGHRFELSPLHLASAGLQLAPIAAWSAHAEASYTGERYLNKRNTAMADAFLTLSAGVARALGRGELRLDGRNLTDRRDPVAESELGDAQYYRLQPRHVELSYAITW